MDAASASSLITAQSLESLDDDMATDQSSTAVLPDVKTAPVHQDILNFVHAQLSNNSIVSRIPPVAVANLIGNTLFVRQKQEETKETLGKHILTIEVYEKNPKEENIGGSSISVKVEGLDKELHSANQREEDLGYDTYFAALLRDPRLLEPRHRRVAYRLQQLAVRRQRLAVAKRLLDERVVAARQRQEASHQRLKASLHRLDPITFPTASSRVAAYGDE